MQGILVVGHGSKSPRALEVLEEVGTSLGAEMPNVTVASMQFDRPDIADAVARMVSQGIDEIIVAPFFLYSGNHVNEDIPAELDALRQSYPQLRYRMAESLGPDIRLVEVLRERVERVLSTIASPAGSGSWRSAGPAGSAGSADSIEPADSAEGNACGGCGKDCHGHGDGRLHPIESESMRIVRGLLAESFGESMLSGADRSIVERLVHTTGDPSLASLVEMSDGVCAAGAAALSAGADVVVDVTMVRSGIHKKRLSGLGGRVLCGLEEPGLGEYAQAEGLTRSAAAIRRMGLDIAGTMVAIGNAPTALFEVLRLIESGVRPAAVIGVPVGFVGAAESKAALVEKAAGVPFVTVTGTRGGSPLAAACVNAMLRECR